VDSELMAGSFEDIGSIAWDSSIIIRDSEEKLHMENLQRWFALGVEYPWLEPGHQGAPQQSN
jgi:hypothetical protein